MSYARWSHSDWYAWGYDNDRLALWHCNQHGRASLSLSAEDCEYILSTKDYKEIEESIADGKITDEETMINCIERVLEDFEEANK